MQIAIMKQLTRLRGAGLRDHGERGIYFISLPDFSSLPDSISLPHRHFVAFVAADARGVDAADLRKFSKKLFHAGSVFFCAWGPNCERVHDTFDEECYEVEPVIMTTWHSNNSLDEALWFLVNDARPDDGYADTTGSVLAISIGSPAWDEQICRRLTDIDGLKRDIQDAE